MATYKQYTKKDGTELWKVKGYLGVDPTTGKEIQFHRQNFKTKKEAQRAYERAKVDFTDGNRQKADKRTFQQVYDEWVEHYRHTVKESTYAKTIGIFDHHILPFFGSMRITKIEVKHCQQAITHWSKSLKRFKLVLNYAGMVFDYCIRIGLIEKNPTKLVTMPIVKESIDEDEEENFYTKDELVRFMECLAKEGDPKVYALFRILAFSGMRKGEALALTWNDINFKDGTVTISKTLTRGEGNRLIIQTPKTANSKRVVSLDGQTLEILKRWRTTQKKTYFMLGYNTMKKGQLVFSNQKNELLQPSVTRKYIVAICEKYGLKQITTHGFRHTHCSLLFEAGASIKEVQDRLGHTDVQTTMNIYAHVTKNRKDETAQKFANYLGF